jgi:hypothetical protein
VGMWRTRNIRVKCETETMEARAKSVNVRVICGNNVPLKLGRVQLQQCRGDIRLHFRVA